MTDHKDPSKSQSRDPKQTQAGDAKHQKDQPGGHQHQQDHKQGMKQPGADTPRKPQQR